MKLELEKNLLFDDKNWTQAGIFIAVTPT